MIHNGMDRKQKHRGLVEMCAIVSDCSVHLCCSSNDVWCFNLENQTWNKQATTDVKPHSRYGQSQISLGDRHVLILGNLIYHNLHNWCLDYPVPGGNKYRNLSLQVWGSLNNMLMSPMGLRPEKGCTGDGQQKLKTTDPTSRQRGRPTSKNP
jgi:hypothetical protein